MTSDLHIYRSAKVLVKGTRAFPVPREGPGFSYRSSSGLEFLTSLADAVTYYALC